MVSDLPFVMRLNLLPKITQTSIMLLSMMLSKEKRMLLQLFLLTMKLLTLLVLLLQKLLRQNKLVL